VITLSEAASNAMLDMLAQLLDGGSIQLMSENRLLAILTLSRPATLPASGGELEFNNIAEEDAALWQGTATTARVLGSDGSEVFSCDVGDLNSDAVIKLNTTKIYQGGPVRIKSFRVAMP
jgi:hypothetical protein